jgi:hypothetical protein
MALTITDRLTAKNGDTYADVAAWETAHGPCGTANTEYVTSGTLTLDDGGASVTRVLVYADEATKDAHVAATASREKTWNSSNISTETT